MDQILPPTLNELELDALRQIAAHPVTRHIPAHIRSRLMDIGYTKEVLGAIVLTDDGLQKIATGIKMRRSVTDSGHSLTAAISVTQCEN